MGQVNLDLLFPNPNPKPFDIVDLVQEANFILKVSLPDLIMETGRRPHVLSKLGFVDEYKTSGQHHDLG